MDQKKTDQPIMPKEVPAKLSLFRKITRRVLGGNFACSYCGKLYKKKCYSDHIGIFSPFPGEGRCCPDGHEGYVDQFNMGGWYDRHTFDYVKNPPKLEPAN